MRIKSYFNVPIEKPFIINTLPINEVINKYTLIKNAIGRKLLLYRAILGIVLKLLLSV